MEQEKKKKRGREENDEAEIVKGKSFDDHETNNNTAKKREKKNKEVIVVEENNNDNDNFNNKGCFNGLDSSSNLGLGVFDFPWLKDGVMSKSEQGFFLDYCCEDSFLSNQDSSFKSDFSEEQQYGLCDNTQEGSSSIAHIPQDKLVQDFWQPFENDNNNNNHGLDFEDSEDVDCIWSSLLNKPL